MNSFRHIFALITLLACLMSLSPVSCCAQEAAPAAYTYDWFLQPDDSVPTKACVYIHPNESPVRLTNDPAFEAEYVWKPHFILEEVTGIPFTIEKITEVLFGTDHALLNSDDFRGEEILMLLPTQTVEAGNSLGFSVNVIPGSGETAFALAIEGTDARGNALTFTCLVPFSYEVNETLTRAHFDIEQVQEEGKPYISITTEENPIPQIYEPAFAGDYGWQYFYSIENVTDEPFTVSRIVEAFVIGENVVYMSEYGPKEFEQWGFPREFVPGAPFCGGSGANTQQGFEYLGLRVEGVDKDGNECVFAELIPFSQERPQP